VLLSFTMRLFLKENKIARFLFLILTAHGSAAVKSHSNYTRDAMEGRGVDRHLLGLRLIAREVRGERCYYLLCLSVASRWTIFVGSRQALPLFPRPLLTSQAGEQQHAFFQDPLVARSSHWNLSTSTVPMAHNRRVGTSAFREYERVCVCARVCVCVCLSRS
jgi:hypothetical protein